MSMGNFNRLPENTSAEIMFQEQLNTGGKALIQLVFSSSILDSDGCVSDEWMAIVDRKESPKFNPDFGRYTLPFTVVNILGQNYTTAEDFAKAKAKDTFYGGRRLAFDEVRDLDLQRVGDNRGVSTLYLPHAVRLCVGSDYRKLGMSDKFKNRGIGRILWEPPEDVRSKLEGEHQRVDRKSSADELAIVENFIELLARQNTGTFYTTAPVEI